MTPHATAKMSCADAMSSPSFFDQTTTESKGRVQLPAVRPALLHSPHEVRQNLI
jgi:hypothetical protein